MAPDACSTGTVSVKVPVPCSRQVSVTAASGARNSANSEIPPSKRYSVVSGASADDLKRIKAYLINPVDSREADLAKPLRGRNFEKGRQAFVDGQCLACHRFGIEGGGVGPDLTAVSARFSRRDVLESILDPSKVVSEQFQNTTVWLKNGDDHTGRLMAETGDQLVLVPNQLQPDTKITVSSSNPTRRSP